MNILFDIGHPAHVHLFKNFIQFLNNNGHSIIVTSRNKDVTHKLLDKYKITHKTLTQPQKTFFGMIYEIIIRDLSILRLHLKYKFDLSFGTSISIGHLSLFSKTKSFNFNEDDDDIVPLYAYVSYPFSNVIVNPTCLRFKRWKNKRILHNSYHELAYLHPDNFTPDINVLGKYDLKPNKFIVIRYSALDAHHDKGAQGLRGNIWEQIEELIKD